MKAESFLNYVMSFGLIFLLSGIACGHATGSPPFSLSWHFATLQSFKNAWAKSGEDRGENPEPIESLTVDAIKGAGQAIANNVEENTGGHTDPRLVSCPKGSVDGSPAPIALAKALPLQGQTMLTQLAIQSALGTPHCNYKSDGKTVWRYLVEGGRTVVATFDSDKVRFQIFNN